MNILHTLEPFLLEGIPLRNQSKTDQMLTAVKTRVPQRKILPPMQPAATVDNNDFRLEFDIPDGI